MKTMFHMVFLFALVTCFGCSRKETPAPEPKPVPEAVQTTETQPAAGAMQQSAPAITAELKKSLAEVDLSKAVETIRQEAAGMDLEQLKETALKYKEALAEKQAAIKAVSEKLAAIPITERLSPEAQTLAGEMKTLMEPVKALTERLAVYVEAIKARGGDAAGLTT